MRIQNTSEYGLTTSNHSRLRKLSCWPPRSKSQDLTPLNLFLMGNTRDRVYANKSVTLEHLEGASYDWYSAKYVPKSDRKLLETEWTYKNSQDGRVIDIDITHIMPRFKLFNKKWISWLHFFKCILFAYILTIANIYYIIFCLSWSFVENLLPRNSVNPHRFWIALSASQRPSPLGCTLSGWLPFEVACSWLPLLFSRYIFSHERV